MSSQPAGTPAGVARFALELSRRLVRQGTHEYVFRSQWRADQLPSEIAEGATIETIPQVTNFLKDLILSNAKAHSTYPASEFDLILNLDALGFGMGGAHRMTIVHDIYFRSMPQMYSRFHRMKSQFIHSTVIENSDVVVCISDATANEVRRHFPKAASKVRTILSDSTMNDVAPGLLPEGLSPQRYVLAVANVTPNKNFDVLAEAFARMADGSPGLRLVHVGGDQDEVFQGRLAKFGMEDRLLRLRGIDDATLASLYANALVLVVPSLFEGFCLPILEAQRLGCPVIFSQTSATGEIGGDGGKSFDPQDVQELQALLREVADKPSVRTDMIARGHVNAERFSWDRTAQSYERAMLDAMGDARPEPRISKNNEEGTQHA